MKARNAYDRLQEWREQSTALQTRIDQRAYALQEHGRLAELRQTLLTLAYDSKAHQSLKQHLKNLAENRRRTFSFRHHP
jgi:hypothetical protein